MSFERMAPEQHDTLDDVPEPSENPVLVGHAQAAATLAAAYRAGKLPHALLLTGPRGIGKATFAFHLAHHLLSLPDHRPAPATLAATDTASDRWRQMAIGSHSAVLHLTRPFDDKAKKFKTVISVEEVRRVSRFLSMKAHDGGYRVVIVDPADDLHRSAANALLKNLEEPPARVLFVLIAHSSGALLPTIRSRCQVVRLAPLPAPELAEALSAIGLGVPAGQEETLAGLAGGSPRMAILLTRYGGLEITGALDRLMSAAQLDVGAAHKLAEAVAGRGGEVPFGILNDHALDLISASSVASARAGELERAAGLSAFWQESRTALDEAEEYNLDRKQHALTMIARLHQMLRG